MICPPPKEKALDLYDKFQCYYWNETEGYMPDDDETKRKVLAHIREIVDLLARYDDFTMSIYYSDVEKELLSL